jgi:hypothetical protein
MHRPNFTAQLSNKSAVITAAAAIGCTQSRGSGKGSGSIRHLLEEIGAGEVLLLFHQYDDPGQLRLASTKLRSAASIISDQESQVLLLALAAALNNAAKIKQMNIERIGYP